MANRGAGSGTSGLLFGRIAASLGPAHEALDHLADESPESRPRIGVALRRRSDPGNGSDEVPHVGIVQRFS
ncbi:MAG: hypothetical protein Q7S80_01440 [bacterium]|nr:hypothetical protein [bacterium]